MFSGILDRDFIDNLVRLAGEAARADGATLYTVDSTRKFLKPFTVYNLPNSYIEGIGLVEVGTQCCGRAVQRKAPWIVSDMLSDPLFAEGVKGARNSDVRAAFSVPVISHEGEAVGSLACHFRKPYRPSHVDIERNEAFATLIATGLEQATSTGDADGWRGPFEAAVRDRDPHVVEEARTAIYARLEQSNNGVPAHDGTLLNALRVLRELAV